MSAVGVPTLLVCFIIVSVCSLLRPPLITKLFMFQIAAARALIDIPELSAADVASKAMNVAADMCIYTNKEFLTETLEDSKDEESG